MQCGMARASPGSSIYCVREGPDLLLIFGDDGEGILPENKERIFTRGFGKHTGLACS